MALRVTRRRFFPARLLALAVVVLAPITGPGAAVASTSVDFGDISHKGLKDLGPASSGLKLSLELGLVANQQGIANAVKAASNPSSSSYGHYLSLSTLQKNYGATSSRRNAVVGAFKNYGVTATVDVTHLRVSATISVKNAQKMFGTKWDLYATGETNQAVALPVDTPKLGSGLAGNVDTVSGLGLYVTEHVSASTSVSHAGQTRTASVDGGTPTRTGTIDPGCATTTYPGGRDSDRWPVSEPDSRRLRDRAAACQWVGGPGHPRRDPRRGADTDQRCHGVSQLLRVPGDDADDPRRLGHRADPRELARRDDARDGGAEARAPRPVGEGARPERSSGRARAARRATPGDDERHPAAERDLDLVRHLRGEREALHGSANAVQPPAGGDVCARDHDGRRGGRQRLVVVRARGADLSARQLRQAEVDVLAGDVTLGARRRRDEPHPHTRERDRVLGSVERHEIPGAVRRRRPRVGAAPAASRTDRGGSRRPRRRRPTGWFRTSRRSQTPVPATRSSARTRFRAAAPRPARRSRTSVARAGPPLSWPA